MKYCSYCKYVIRVGDFEGNPNGEHFTCLPQPEKGKTSPSKKCIHCKMIENSPTGSEKQIKCKHQQNHNEHL